MNKCGCGCGGLTSGKIDHGKISKYINGHQNIGRKYPFKPRLKARGRIPWNKGMRMTDKQKSKMDMEGLKLGVKYQNHQNYRGENSPMWKGGITPINKKIRKSLKYKKWRKAVFKRDDFSCQVCGGRGIELHADHIKGFAAHEDLRFDINNGRTLCIGCYKKTDNYGGRGRKNLAPIKEVVVGLC